MNTTDSQILPGYILSSITVLGRSTLLEATITTAALLSGIAGLDAALEGPGGELIHPGLNVITTGRETPSSTRLRELLIKPIVATQRQLRETARTLSPSKLDQSEFGRFNDNTKDLIARSDATRSPSPYKHEIGILRRPTFLLQSPDLETIRKALPEILNGSPLILCEMLFDELASNKETQRLITELAILVAGQDRPAEGVDSRVGPGRTDTLRAHLFVSSTKDVLREALASQNASVQQLLRRCIHLDSSGFSPGKSRMEWEQVRFGYNRYYNCVREIIEARRNGGGVQWKLAPAAYDQLHELTGELQNWVSGLSEPLKPFFADVLSLPYRLYWTCATLQLSNEQDWVLPITIRTTRKLFEHQKAFLSELITAAEAQEHQKARVTMLRKLSERPCIFRDLLRRYSVQRRDIHEPVLNTLIGEGLIQLRSNGFLELSEKGREELVA